MLKEEIEYESTYYARSPSPDYEYVLQTIDEKGDLSPKQFACDIDLGYRTMIRLQR